jgi:hypothetical protein
MCELSITGICKVEFECFITANALQVLRIKKLPTKLLHYYHYSILASKEHFPKLHASCTATQLPINPSTILEPIRKSCQSKLPRLY